MADEFEQLSPHADLEIINRIKDGLHVGNNGHAQKRKMLKLLKKLLKRYPIMSEESEAIELICRFYNYGYKKFYFIVDFTDSFEVFLPVISEIYATMDKSDLYQIFSLPLFDSELDLALEFQKPINTKDFEKQFVSVENDRSRSKMKINAKGMTRMSYEKYFHRILETIESESKGFSRYLVIILGGENESHSRTSNDIETSSLQYRQQYQEVHKDIISIMEGNFFHNILIGFNLRDYQTKQGRIKKHAKHCFDLLEIDLVNGYGKEQTEELEVFLKK